MRFVVKKRTSFLPQQCWEETQQEVGARLRRCCADINVKLKVEELCSAFPKRVDKLVAAEGGRLKE